MEKIFFRYLLYFVGFISFIQLIGHSTTRTVLKKIGVVINFEGLETYAPLFISILLIDVTYRIGKRQNEIQERQYKLEKYKLYEGLYANLYELDKLLKEFIHIQNEGLCNMFYDLGFRGYEYRIGQLREVEKRFKVDESSISLKLSNSTVNFNDISQLFAEINMITEIVYGKRLSMIEMIKHDTPSIIKKKYDGIIEEIHKIMPNLNFTNSEFNGNDLNLVLTIQDKAHECMHKIYMGYDRNYTEQDEIIKFYELCRFIGMDSEYIHTRMQNFIRLRNQVFVESDIINKLRQECAVDL